MGELYKFQDKRRSDQDRAKPVETRELDQNFAIVRTQVASSLASLFKVKDNSPKADELELNTSSTGTFLVTIQNGAINLISISPTGKYILTVQNGTISLLEAPSGGTQFLSSTSGTLGFTDSEECP